MSDQVNDHNSSKYTSLSTHALHADRKCNYYTDVTPALHVSTTFRYPDDPSALITAGDPNHPLLQPHQPNKEPPFIYSRESGPNATRLETVLRQLLGAEVVSYASGLAAFHAMLTYLNPKVIAISGGYHGCHGVIGIHKKLSGLKVVELNGSDEEWDNAGLGKGDVVHVETPLNPFGTATDLAHFADRAHKRGAYLSVDATFAPPPLQDPFKQGTDIVMHAGTKYIGGHSDLLCGVLAVREASWLRGLKEERLFLGGVMGSLEGWLGVRSLRTLELRVKRQSESATALVKWINGCLEGSEKGDGAEAVKEVFVEIKHASLQKEKWVEDQMPGGYGPVFAVYAKDRETAKRLPSRLGLFQHATSLGGVESLIEWRRMSDEGCDDRLLRISVGVEGVEDLKNDIEEGCAALAKEMGS